MLMKKSKIVNFLYLFVFFTIITGCKDCKNCDNFTVNTVILDIRLPKTYIGRVCPIPHTSTGEICKGKGESWPEYLTLNQIAAQNVKPQWDNKKYVLWVEFTGCEKYASDANFLKLVKDGLAHYLPSSGTSDVKGFYTYYVALNVNSANCFPTVDIPVELSNNIPNLIVVKYMEPCSYKCEEKFCPNDGLRAQFTGTRSINLMSGSGTEIFELAKDGGQCGYYCK
jgi:hypothetical protein